MTRTKKTMLAVAALGAMAFAGSASAAGTATLNITGTLAGTCNFFASGYNMNFTLDPTSLTDSTATVNVGYRCTTGTAPTSFMINSSLSPSPASITNGTTTLPVSLTWTAPTTIGAGFGAAPAINIPVLGTIPFANVNTATAGSYSSVTYVMTLAP